MLPYFNSHVQQFVTPRRLRCVQRFESAQDLQQCHFPVPVDDDLSSLSSILMDEDYYNFTINNTTQHEGLRLAEPQALICLKAFAYINMIVQMEKGEKIDEKNIRKHRSDVFRLMLLLPGDRAYAIPEVIQGDLKRFVEVIGTDLPDKKFFREVGAANIDPAELYSDFKKNFGLE